MTLRPFFTYYGGKWRSAAKYPAPIHGQIIEPFAGSAGYATRHPHLQVHLNDANPVVAGIWDYLIHVPADEVRRLPIHFDHVDEIDVPTEARDFIGFWLNKGVSAPRRSPSAWMRAGTHINSFWGETVRERTAQQVEAVRHWTVSCGDYADLPKTRTATWFIDPPYDADCGSHYSARVDSFADLGDWCRSLPGQVIACEKQGADWLPFVDLHQAKAMHGSSRLGASAEAIWTNKNDSASAAS